MNCDICGVHVSEEDTFIALPETVTEATEAGFMPSSLPASWATDFNNQGITEPTLLHAAINAQWNKVVADNASVDWVLCPDCHLELIQYRKH